MKFQRRHFLSSRFLTFVHRLFLGTDGHFILTVSYDNTIKLWMHPVWSALYSSTGHEQKIMAADMSLNGKWIVTVSYDRTLKIWSPEYIN